MTSWIKSYIEKHKDELFTIALILLADEYLFSGKFRHRLEGIVESALKRIEKKIEAPAA